MLTVMYTLETWTFIFEEVAKKLKVAISAVC
jgi:hypothetical protein